MAAGGAWMPSASLLASPLSSAFDMAGFPLGQHAPCQLACRACQGPCCGALVMWCTCSLLLSVFATREELAAHMKTDWHKHNLALKSAGKPMLTSEQFLDFKIMSQDGVAVGGGGGGGEGGKNASKAAGGKKGKGKKDIDLWD